MTLKVEKNLENFKIINLTHKRWSQTCACLSLLIIYYNFGIQETPCFFSETEWLGTKRKVPFLETHWICYQATTVREYDKKAICSGAASLCGGASAASCTVLSALVCGIDQKRASHPFLLHNLQGWETQSSWEALNLVPDLPLSIFETLKKCLNILNFQFNFL